MRILSLPLVMLILLGSHTPVSAQEGSTRLTIIATTTIMADVVAQVAGNAADVSSLMGYGADPHTFQPTPQDVVALDEADVVFVNGANFESTLLEIINEAAGENVYVLSACVEILPLGEDDIEHEVDDEATESKWTEVCAEHFVSLELTEDSDTLGRLYAIDCGVAENEDEHAHSDCDPHVWLDVQNVMLWTLMARDVLSERDPANAEMYAANAEAYLMELVTLETELEEAFAAIPTENRILVTNHDVLGYFAHHYDFTVVGTVLPNPSSEASVEDILSIAELVEDTGVTAIFTDNTINNAIAEQIAEETGATLYPMYTDSLSEEVPTYLEYMRHNAETILLGLGVDGDA
jgi:ABC-type Zn uptake system ZnuABC Zn-binding protein ZnuA